MSERNCYYALQLTRTGRDDLVAAVQRDEMKLHKALCLAGLLPKLEPYDKLLRGVEPVQ